MDPNELLAKLRQVADEGRKFAEGVQTHPDGMTENEEALSGLVVELSSHFWALDTWLMRGGFMPDAWKPELRSLLLGERVVVEPLGPVDPAGAELPTPEGSQMESQYPRDFEDGEGIHARSYGE